MEINLKTTDHEVYPMLTMELLQGLRVKILRGKTTASDCALLDHYLTSIGAEGHLQKMLMKYGVLSFDDIRSALIQTPGGVDFVPLEITYSLIGCIRGLAKRVARGEKIY